MGNKCNHTNVFNGVCGICLMPVPGAQHDNKGQLLPPNTKDLDSLYAEINRLRNIISEAYSEVADGQYSNALNTLDKGMDGGDNG